MVAGASVISGCTSEWSMLCCGRFVETENRCGAFVCDALLNLEPTLWELLQRV